MAARRPSVLNAIIELAFVLLAGAAGYLGAPLYTALPLSLAMMIYWFINRRAALGQLRQRGLGQLAGMFAISVALLFAVLAAAFCVGTILPGSKA